MLGIEAGSTNETKTDFQAVSLTERTQKQSPVNTHHEVAMATEYLRRNARELLMQPQVQNQSFIPAINMDAVSSDSVAGSGSPVQDPKTASNADDTGKLPSVSCSRLGSAWIEKEKQLTPGSIEASINFDDFGGRASDSCPGKHKKDGICIISCVCAEKN